MTFTAPFETGFAKSFAWNRATDWLRTAIRQDSSACEAVRTYHRVGRSEWSGFRHLALRNQQDNGLSHTVLIEEWQKCWAPSADTLRLQ